MSIQSPYRNSANPPLTYESEEISIDVGELNIEIEILNGDTFYSKIEGSGPPEGPYQLERGCKKPLTESARSKWIDELTKFSKLGFIEIDDGETWIPIHRIKKITTRKKEKIMTWTVVKNK